jgi:AcrR family transcriptional regulator
MAEKMPGGGTRALILEAGRRQLLAAGFAGMSTRKVAQEAGVLVSQLNYHFGSKQGLILTLLEDENRRRLARQTAMYAEDMPLWKRYEQACDFLEDDLESGYVRVLQEMIAAGWTDPQIGEQVRGLLRGWIGLVTEVAREAERRHGLGPFTAEEVGALISTIFMGSEALLLLGFDRQELPIRVALRRIGALIRELDEGGGGHAGLPAGG